AVFELPRQRQRAIELGARIVEAPRTTERVVEIEPHVDLARHRRGLTRDSAERVERLLERADGFLVCAATERRVARTVRVRRGRVPRFGLAGVRGERERLHVEIVRMQTLDRLRDASMGEPAMRDGQ